MKEIILQDIDLKTAKRQIAKYFKENDGKEIGYSDIFNHLRIEIELIVQACDELEYERKIK